MAVVSPPKTAAETDGLTRPRRIMLVSNPNAGKTTLFNALTGLRHKTANFPGTTLDVRTGVFNIDSVHHRLYDMPGLYTLEAGNAEERVAVDALRGDVSGENAPDLIVVVLDASNLARHLFLASQLLEEDTPVVVALNMVDVAKRDGMEIDSTALEEHLGCPVVPTIARKGVGMDRLREVCAEKLRSGTANTPPKLLSSLETPTTSQRYSWAETVAESCVTRARAVKHPVTERVDKLLTHPVTGTVAFFGVMFAVFYLIFSLATIPMNLIDGAFGTLGSWIASALPEGQLNNLVVDGIIAGVGGVLVFLPQICILFFCIAVLEDTGYLARGACVLDKVLRRVGLPGKAFVPMLSAHACAIPAIMSTRIIEDKNDRLITILVLPLMTCSARLPVYAMVTALLFPTAPLMGAAAFTGAYALGICAAMSMAWIFRQTLVKSKPAPLVIELPTYKMPSVKTALMTAYDRGWLFVRKAGTVILALSIILWWLMNYPRPDAPVGTAAPVEVAAPAGAEVAAPVETIDTQEALRQSFAGRMGRAIEPVLEPLGFDWRIGVGVIASFAAREVIVSALSVVYGVGEEGAEDTSLLIDKLRAATRADGTPVFTLATSMSLLVFYVLAMQCLPTQATARRETGGWKWPAFQLGYMTVLAYTAAFVTYQGFAWFGGA